MNGGVNPLNYGLKQLLGLRHKFHRVPLGEFQCGLNLKKLKQTQIATIKIVTWNTWNS